MPGQRSWSRLLFSASLLASGPAQAFTYEVLFEDTIGRDAVVFGRTPGFQALAKIVLLDGQVDTSGTNTITYDRVLINYAKYMQQFAVGGNASVRFSLPALVNYAKQEGEQVPREVTEATWVETKPKFEFVYATQNALDIILGIDGYYVGGHEAKTESAFFNATNKFDSAATSYGHLAVVKHGGNFDGGFYFKSAAEKKRNVTKSTDIDESSFVAEDRIYDPATIAIFMRSNLSFGKVFGEFAAVEASGGGNRTDRGATVKEDYFRVQVAGFFPLAGNLGLESSLIYKSLSYADNRNITMDTIPMLGLQIKLNVNMGIPVFAGIIGVSGSDGQSIPEFNAKYKLFGFGGIAGIQSNF
ncbi:MAG TPA: hypothetical protein VE954_42970 [Oligoflexus sp.]|uniref:hypothetical protein n=1 Tax=Oligoflexus sp. TaxID=1971216 RepID=UPI002D305BD2|nr:hypothetical protein [Oligoflexus sp.]HYX39906.1 hypothetical protein [Oligoflexus sp.]